MSIWKRINDILTTLAHGTSGVALTLSSAFDPDNWLPGGRDAAFTVALVALSAKMAVADGVVSASEVRAFRSIVEISPESEEQVSRLFALAQQDVAGFESYARKVARMFFDSPETLEHVLEGLFRIASADAYIHEAELEFLKNVSDIFGFDDVRFEQIAAAFIVSDAGTDPYLVLGLSPEAPADEVKKVYRLLVAENHPDRLIARGVPEEMITLATARMAAINSAYAMIMKRGERQ